MKPTNQPAIRRALARAITRIAQQACRNGESGERRWPELHDLAHKESWECVGEEYADQIMADLLVASLRDSDEA